ncbi:MAG: zinc ribbon domain-containing protein [Planctomycetes bacterium]|nr:zinc ribbon domain-containing protein [Planctomycetota bacterium]
MPLYQYSCNDCEKNFEALVNRGETAECPECHSRDVEKMPTMPGMPVVKDAGGCGDLSLPPCGAAGCRRTGKG